MTPVIETSAHVAGSRRLRNLPFPGDVRCRASRNADRSFGGVPWNRRSVTLAFCLTLLLLMTGEGVRAQDPKPQNQYLQFVKRVAGEQRAADAPPVSLQAWEQQKQILRERLSQAWGGFPAEHVSLEPRILESLNRDGYTVEKLVFQTLPDVWMTANAYVPDGSVRRPAVLCVHGHWSGAKQDPHVQARCIGLAKLGFFVLAVDAMGAGERAIGKALGEYHGEMVAATLWPIGRPLSGLQVYENQRAVDYLLTRPEVDGSRLGITGASGGGNQSMYAGAWDERFRAVVPVCSVGNYQAYLGAACCMCEVVPGALDFTEEWGVLSLTAPRALMVISATKDAFQFSVAEAAKSIKAAQPIFAMYQKSDSLRHAVFESPHDYNREMREAMYGWMTLHLKEQGDGSPIPEPDMTLEEPEMLRCFPGDSRPDDWVTLPTFAFREAQRLVQQHSMPISGSAWKDSVNERRRVLENVLGGTLPEESTKPELLPKNDRTDAASGHSAALLKFSPSPGIDMTAELLTPPSASDETVLFVHADSEGAAESVELVKQLRNSRDSVLIMELRATGKLGWPSDKIGRAPDHNSAEWALWLGRPLLGQWVQDIRAAIKARQSLAASSQKITVVGFGPAGLAAICSAALDSGIRHTVAVNTLATYVSAGPYTNQRLALMVPGILRDVGDVAHLAALAAPARLSVVGGVSGEGTPLTLDQLRSAFAFTNSIYHDTWNADKQLEIAPPDSSLPRLLQP